MVSHLTSMLQAGVTKLIVSNPCKKTSLYKKIVAEKKQSAYQISKYTDKQVYHENLSAADLPSRLSELTLGSFRQVNGFASGEEHILLVSAKGACKHSVKKNDTSVKQADNHNRKKQYLLEEGKVIPPLVDMGIFTKDGKVVSSMYHKYKQINRFLEIIDDELSDHGKELHIIDFGCGKSYLTFILYYYLTEVKHIPVQMVGLDLKADVIAKCNAAAEAYGYTGLRFEMGDINGYKAPFEVDMVVTLHACDTATDYALFNAVSWNARMIFSVPCCQHELNGQLAPKEELTLFSRYGIVGERFSALATDAIRANLLEYMGYKTQLLEFIDLDHTPKNILIRAVKRPITPKAVKVRALQEVRDTMESFGFQPTLYKLFNP